MAVTEVPVSSSLQGAPDTEHAVPVAVRRSEQAWRQLGLRIRSITPSGLARFVLALGAIGVVGWLFASAWRELLPFQLGLALAYITLPLVNWLDRFMPRGLAATTVVLIELLSAVLFFGLLVPPVVGDLAQLAATLSSTFDPREVVAQLRERLAALPEPARDLVADAARQASDGVRGNVAGYVQQAGGLALAGILGAFTTLGAILGFTAIPTWLVSVLTSQRVGERALTRSLPDWMRDDFLAVMHILDRTLGTYLRGQFASSLAVGVATYVGLVALQHLIWPELKYPLLLAMIAAVLNLIPTLGPILATIPAVLLAALVGPDAAVTVLGLYVLIQQLEGMFIQPMIARRTVDIHPVILVVLLVLLSQFGFIWVLLGAPLAVSARDLFRYAYGRLSDPPRPAGVMPDSPRWNAYGRSTAPHGVTAARAARMSAGALPAEIVALAAARRTRRGSTSLPNSRMSDVSS